jgi:hypothetical protein
MSSTSRPSPSAEFEKLAFKLHASSHLSARDLDEMCRRAGILSPQLAHYLKLAAQSCLSCLRTARPKPSKKNFTLERRQRITQLHAGRYFLSGWCRPASHLTCCGYPHKGVLWLDYAKTGILSCWQVLLSVNGSMFKDHQLRCRVARSFPKDTFRCSAARTNAVVVFMSTITVV